MKKQLLKFGAICVALALGGNAMAQQKTATILNIGANTVTVDGVAEGVWAGVDPVAIETIFGTETPSIDVTWKMIWSAEGTYVLIEAADDVWNPFWLSGAAGWASDHVELYFDVSDPQQDGGGPANAEQLAAGNYQVAPDFLKESGKDTTEANGRMSATVFDGEGVYTKEFFVPFASIQQAGATINPEVMDVIGFDVSISDNDGNGRQRQVWNNDGLIGDAPNESWNNCDMVGLITFSADEVAAGDAIKQNVAPINVSVVNGELKFSAAVKNVTVHNSIGQVVAKNANVSNLPKGVYVVTAKTTKGDVASKFVIK